MMISHTEIETRYKIGELFAIGECLSGAMTSLSEIEIFFNFHSEIVEILICIIKCDIPTKSAH